MRRPNRNIEIFSVSVLDLFASALGGFILIAVILFPSYLAKEKLTPQIAALKTEVKVAEAQVKTVTEERDQTEQALAEAKQDASAAQAALTVAEETIDANHAVIEDLDKTITKLKLEAAQTFLLISIDWPDNLDVDLAVTDPEGHEYTFSKPNKDGALYNSDPDPVTGEMPKTWSELSRDQQYGPGVEIWQAPLAVPGSYEVDVHLYSASRVEAGQEIVVKLVAFGRVQRMTRDVVLTKETPKQVFWIDLADDGTWTVRE